MMSKSFELLTQTARIAVFCSFLTSLLAPQNVIASPPPSITVQPTSKTVSKHANVVFSVTATSSTKLTYQWNNKTLGIAIPGATNSSMTISNVSSTNAGKYYVTVVNAGGTVKSSDATLTVTNKVPVANNDAFNTEQNIPITNAIALVNTTVSSAASLLAASSSTLASILDQATVINPVSVLDNDSDPDADALTATLVATTRYGVLAFYTNGTFNYTPSANFIGNDSFTYYATDGTDKSTIATVNIMVTAPVNTNAAPPDAITSEPLLVLSTSATLSAIINPQGYAASYYFQYGTTTNYGMASEPTAMNSDTNSSKVFTTITGLEPGKTYHCSVVATTSGGMTPGNDITFTTTLYDTTPIVIAANGPGTITPDLNGQSLIIGQSYSLSATPFTGCSLTGWRDANDFVVSTNLTLGFVMASNVSFTAVFTDATKPILTIVNSLAASTSSTVSNQAFALSGTATDNISVTNIFYNLNNVGWLSAWDSYNGSNWMANLLLNSGTNTVASFAIDSSGNCSTTNTAVIFYAPTAVLTVMTNGPGSISPVLNGANVRIGSSLTLTATPTTGCAFNGWTDGNGLLITNKAAFTFVMTTNLVLVANMIDTNKPIVTVTTPSNLLTTTNEFLAATGKASDNITLANVFYQLNGGNWYLANTTNGWTNWSVTLDLASGTNSFSIYAADSTGNFSITNNTKIIYSTAPSSLLKTRAWFAIDGGIGYELAFGTNTFSLFSTDSNILSSVGTYVFTKLSPNLGNLKLTFTAPPQSTNLAQQNFNLLFDSANAVRFNNLVSGEAGSALFTSTTNLVPSSLAKLPIFYVSADGNASSNVFSTTNVISTDLLTRGTTKWTNYTYTYFSPLCALLRERNSNITSYLVLYFASTNYGFTYSENYGNSGSLSGENTGFFAISSQRTGGNAPTNLLNCNLVFGSGGPSFKLSMSTNSFAQFSPTAAFDCGVGSYTYNRSTTNVGLIKLSYLAPASLSGSTDSASLLFVSPSAAIYTNSDGTYGAASLGKTLNLAPIDPSGLSISAINQADGSFCKVSLFSGGSFITEGTQPGSGTFTYSNYSTESGMVQLTFTNDSLAGSTAFLQLDFGSTVVGRYFPATATNAVAQ